MVPFWGDSGLIKLNLRTTFTVGSSWYSFTGTIVIKGNPAATLVPILTSNSAFACLDQSSLRAPNFGHPSWWLLITALQNRQLAS